MDDIEIIKSNAKIFKKWSDGILSSKERIKDIKNKDEIIEMFVKNISDFCYKIDHI